jgi:sec-independent protein translocase protein TatB
MFDIGASEFLLVVIVAIVVIGPKDLPLALRTAGRWIGKIRRVSGHFRAGIETMIREAELEEMERKWREQNAAIMAAQPAADAVDGSALPPPAHQTPSAPTEPGVPAFAQPGAPAVGDEPLAAAPEPLPETAAFEPQPATSESEPPRRPLAPSA